MAASTTDNGRPNTERAPLTPRSRRKAAAKAKNLAWETMQADAATAIDARLAKVANKLDRQLRAKDTDSFWHTWSQATEAGMIDFLSHQEGNDDPENVNGKSSEAEGDQYTSAGSCTAQGKQRRPYQAGVIRA